MGAAFQNQTPPSSPPQTRGSPWAEQAQGPGVALGRWAQSRHQPRTLPLVPPPASPAGLRLHPSALVPHPPWPLPARPQRGPCRSSQERGAGDPVGVSPPESALHWAPECWARPRRACRIPREPAPRSTVMARRRPLKCKAGLCLTPGNSFLVWPGTVPVLK